MPHRWRSLALAAALLLSLPSPARAIDEQSTQGGTTKSLTDYLSDLEGDSEPDRLYASRVLRGNLKRALHTEATAREGSLAYDDARLTLVELEARLPHACMASLTQANVVAPCAEILGMLQVREAVPSLKALLPGEKRKWVRRKIEGAITSIEALPPVEGAG